MDLARSTDAEQAGSAVSPRQGGGDRHRGITADQLRLFAARVAVGAVALCLWEAVSGTLVNPFWISSPLEIAGRLEEWMITGVLWHHLGITLSEVCAGYAIGAALGVVMGLALGLNPWLSQVFDPYIVAIYSIPKIALAPLFIVWFGLGPLSKIVLVCVVVLFLVFYNSFSGVREVEQELKDVLRLMGATRWQIIRKLILPSAVVWIFAGMKISVPYALVAAVVGEIMASNRGIGFLIQSSSGQFDTAGVFAAIFVLMILSTLLNAALRHSESFFLRWRQ